MSVIGGNISRFEKLISSSDSENEDFNNNVEEKVEEKVEEEIKEKVEEQNVDKTIRDVIVESLEGDFKQSSFEMKKNKKQEKQEKMKENINKKDEIVIIEGNRCIKADKNGCIIYKGSKFQIINRSEKYSVKKIVDGKNDMIWNTCFNSLNCNKKGVCNHALFHIFKSEDETLYFRYLDFEQICTDESCKRNNYSCMKSKVHLSPNKSSNSCVHNVPSQGKTCFNYYDQKGKKCCPYHGPFINFSEEGGSNDWKNGIVNCFKTVPNDLDENISFNPRYVTNNKPLNLQEKISFNPNIIEKASNSIRPNYVSNKGSDLSIQQFYNESDESEDEIKDESKFMLDKIEDNKKEIENLLKRNEKEKNNISLATGKIKTKEQEVEKYREEKSFPEKDTLTGLSDIEKLISEINLNVKNKDGISTKDKDNIQRKLLSVIEKSNEIMPLINGIVDLKSDSFITERSEYIKQKQERIKFYESKFVDNEKTIKNLEEENEKLLSEVV